MRSRWIKFRNYWVGGPDSPWVRLKWWLTNRWWNNGRPDTCWANACDWALGFDTLDATRANVGCVTSCQEEAARLGSCWCGKFGCEAVTRELCDGQLPDWWKPPCLVRAAGERRAEGEA